jgi:hypothetical protein
MKAVRVASGPKEEIGEFGATWMLVTDDAGFLARPEVAAHARLAVIKDGLKVWTDDYSSLLPVLHW